MYFYKPLSERFSGAIVKACLLAVISTVGEPCVASEPLQAGARLFTTKVYPGHGILSQADFDQIANAGFDVALNRWIEDVPTYAQRADNAGLKVMPWSKGLLSSIDPNDQTVTQIGLTTHYTTPASDYAWSTLQNKVVNYATMSLTQTNISGIALDFEIYDPNKLNGFSESYDDTTFGDFMMDATGSIPTVSPASRRGYLSSAGLLDPYFDAQFQTVSTKMANLRTAVDAINDKFQIGVYGWGNLIEAVRENAGHANAPVLIMDAATYGRGPDDADRPALKWSLLEDADHAEAAASLSYPNIHLGGHYPQASGPGDGTQYNFTVRQSFNSSAYVDGYWIWTDWGIPSGWQGSKQEWIDAMMSDYGEAHAALDAGDYGWATRQEVQIADPNATDSLLVLTTDGLNVTVWDPLTGQASGTMPSIIPPNPNLWQNQESGDVDAISGNENVKLLGNGWLSVVDPATNVEILRFFVGAGETGISLVDAGPQLLGDLDYDGDIDDTDYSMYLSGVEMDLTALTNFQGYQVGDLDSDGVNSILDFILFKDSFNAANGVGAFAAMVAGVPEPSSVVILYMASFALILRKVRGAKI